MHLVFCSLRSILPFQGRQRSFVFSVAAELCRPALAETASDTISHPEIAPAIGGGLGIPENTQAALAKISIRSQ